MPNPIPFPVYQPLASLVGSYLTACEAEGLSPRTTGSYSEKLHNYCRYLEAQGLPTTAPSLDTETLRGFLAFLRSSWHEWASISRHQPKPLSPFTMKGYVRVLKGFSRWLCEEGLIPKNSLVRFPIPKVPRLAPKSLNGTEVRRLLSALKKASPRDRAIVLLMLDTGLRLGEVVSLTTEALETLDSGQLMVVGKGGKARAVPVGSVAQDALRIYLRTRQNRDGALFLSENGYPLTDSGFHSLFRRLGKRAGGIDLHPHRLRHTFARLWIANGGDAVSLQHILGHSSVVMSAHYARLWGQDTKQRHRELGVLEKLMASTRRKRGG